MRIVDLRDTEEEFTLLRMTVNTEGHIVRCEGPMAFFVEGFNEILKGQLGPSDVAELLDLQSGAIEYEIDECPPLPFVTAALGDLLKDDIVLRQLRETLSDDIQSIRGRRIR